MKTLVRATFAGGALLFLLPAIVVLLAINLSMFLTAPLFYIVLMTAIVTGCGAAACALLWAFDA